MSGEADVSIERRAAKPRKVALNKEARFSRILLLFIPLVTLGAIVLARLAIDSRKAKAMVGIRLKEELVAKTASSVVIGGIRYGWAYQPCLDAVSIGRETQTLAAAFKAKEACVDHWASAIGSLFRAVRIRIKEPQLTLEGIRGLAPSEPSKEPAKARGDERAAATRALLRELTLEFDDLTLDWKDLPLPDRVKSGRLGPIDGVVTLQQRGPRSQVTLALREPRTGLTAKGRATPTNAGWDLALTIEGDLAPTVGPLLADLGLDVKKLPVNGEIGVIYDAKARKIALDLDLYQHDVDVAQDLVSARRLTGFSAHERLVLEIDLAAGELRTRDALVEINGVPLTLSFLAKTNLGAPSFDASISIPTVPMARLLSSIPGTEALGDLAGLSPSVLFALTFGVSGQLRDPESWKAELEHRVIGVGPGGEKSGLEFLRWPSWEFRPLTKQGRAERALPMGPQSGRWLSIGAIPYAMRRAVQVSEDASFFVHKGIDIEEIRMAIVTAMTRDARARGGSTLSQQLIKNLFLTRDRTALRKIQELLLTFLLEASLTKDQIFETYLNVIEWGPGVYGLKDAAQHYFGRPVSQLNAREMAYLASIIPGPVLYHAHFEQGFVPRGHLAKVEATLEKLVALKTLTPDQVLPIDIDPIRFRRSK